MTFGKIFKNNEKVGKAVKYNGFLCFHNEKNENFRDIMVFNVFIVEKAGTMKYKCFHSVWDGKTSVVIAVGKMMGCIIFYTF